MPSTIIGPRFSTVCTPVLRDIRHPDTASYYEHGIGSRARDLHVGELVEGGAEVGAVAVVAAGPAAVGDRHHLRLRILVDGVEDRADAGAGAAPLTLEELRRLLGSADRV